MAKAKTKAGRLKPILMILLVFGPASLLVLISLNKCEHKFTELPNFGSIGTYEFTTHDGKSISQKTQESKITIFTTLQLTCPEQCAINLPKFNLLLYQDLRKNRKKLGHVEVVSIVTDSLGNSVNNLEELMFTLQDVVVGYDSDIWRVVTGDPKQVYDIESNGVNLYEQLNDTAFAKKPFTETLMLVDKENDLRIIRRGNREGYIRDFKQHLALLQKQYDKNAYKERQLD